MSRPKRRPPRGVLPLPMPRGASSPYLSRAASYFAEAQKSKEAQYRQLEAFTRARQRREWRREGPEEGACQREEGGDGADDVAAARRQALRRGAKKRAYAEGRRSSVNLPACRTVHAEGGGGRYAIAANRKLPWHDAGVFTAVEGERRML